jgi:hypothetical protein
MQKINPKWENFLTEYYILYDTKLNKKSKIYIKLIKIIIIICLLYIFFNIIGTKIK